MHFWFKYFFFNHFIHLPTTPRSPRKTQASRASGWLFCAEQKHGVQPKSNNEIKKKIIIIKMSGGNLISLKFYRAEKEKRKKKVDKREKSLLNGNDFFSLPFFFF